MSCLLVLYRVYSLRYVLEIYISFEELNRVIFYRGVVIAIGNEDMVVSIEDISRLQVLRQDGSCSQHTVHLVCRPPQDTNEGPSTSRTSAAGSHHLQQDNPRVLRTTGVAADAANG